MLEYLVSSKARRALLRLLWKENASASTSELARLAHISFAAAHRELKAMEKAGLTLKRGEGNAVIYQANAGHPQATLLRGLLLEEESPAAQQVDQDFKWEKEALLHLKELGAPLVVSGSCAKSLSLEETLAEALKLSHQNATVARVMPVVLAKHREAIDFTRLEHLAKRSGEQMTLGFFLELTAMLSGNPSFRKRAQRLFDKRIQVKRDFFLTVRGKYAGRLSRMNTPPVAKKWHFQMNMGMDSFKTCYQKFASKSPI